MSIPRPDTCALRAVGALDGNGRMYVSGWAATGAQGVLASTMLDAYAVTDAILSYQFGDGGAAEYECSEDKLVADDVVDLGCVPKKVEEGGRASRVAQYEQWKEIDRAETWYGPEASKENDRMDREAHQLLMRHERGRVSEDLHIITTYGE